MRRNLNTTLRLRAAPRDPMRDFDRLPPELRRWLAGALLPWSAASALRIWRRAGSVAEARRRLERAQSATLSRESGGAAAALVPRSAARPR